MSENLTFLSARKGLDNNLFDRIKVLAKGSNGLIREDVRKLAKEYLIGEADVWGTASFYDFLKQENKEKKIYICNGTACLMAGTQDKLRHEIGKHFDEKEIGNMCCLGRCYENNAFHFKGGNYSGGEAEEIEAILTGALAGSKNSYEVFSSLKEPILTAPFPGADRFYQLLKKLLKKDPPDILEEITSSGLLGRGGAGFPLGLKLEACMKADSDQKFVVCNADEGDPGSFSDRYLLEIQPHLVLFGMIMAGYITGANRGVLYIRAEYPETIDIVKQAIEELGNNGLTGININNNGFDFLFKIVEGAGSYICGEETALLNSIEGQRPEVRIRPPYPTEYGLFGRPTVVSNVETLANLHYILDKGGKAFAALGTKKSTGGKLICLDGFFKRPGIYEVEMGTPFSKVIYDMAGGFKKQVKALQVGGPLGGIVPSGKIDGLTLDFETFRDHGFLLGHASIVSIPEDFPMIQYLEHLFEFTAAESCGKCFPCRLGSIRGREMLGNAYKNNYKIDSQLFDDLLEALEEGSLCGLGSGLPLPVRNVLQHFPEELAFHFEYKKSMNTS